MTDRRRQYRRALAEAPSLVDLDSDIVDAEHADENTVLSSPLHTFVLRECGEFCLLISEVFNWAASSERVSLVLSIVDTVGANGQVVDHCLAEILCHDIDPDVAARSPRCGNRKRIRLSFGFRLYLLGSQDSQMDW